MCGGRPPLPDVSVTTITSQLSARYTFSAFSTVARSCDDEPMFQDGIIARAVNAVTADGASYYQLTQQLLHQLDDIDQGFSQAQGLPMRHHSRRISSSMGESMAWRSLRPLPCSTRSTMRALSMSDTFSDTTSEALSPAP